MITIFGGLWLATGFLYALAVRKRQGDRRIPVWAFPVNLLIGPIVAVLNLLRTRV